MKQKEFGVILEDIDGKLDRVAESQEGFSARMDKVERKLDGFIEETNSNFKSVFEYLSRIDDELKEIRGEIADLRKSLFANADLERLEALERRVEQMEIQLIKYKNYGNG